MNKFLLHACIALASSNIVACSSESGTEAEAQFDLNVVMGTTANHVLDPMPTTRLLGEQLNSVSQVTTSSGNQFVLQFSSSAVVNARAYEVGVGKPVQAGFTIPGMSGTIFFESGTLTVTALDWSAGGRLQGQLTGAHRPADALGVAPEATVSGSLNLSVPSSQ